MLEIKEGKPYLWRTLNYGDVAVHLVSVNDSNGVLKISIDGGEASTPAQRYPELADGEAFTLANKLFRRPTRTTKPRLPTAKQVRNVSAKEAASMVVPAGEVTF